MDNFEIFISFIEIFIIYCFFDIYFSREKNLNYILSIIFFLISFLVTILTKNSYLSHTYLVFITIIINVVYVSLQYKKDILENILINFLIYNIVTLIDLTIITAASILIYENLYIVTFINSNNYELILLLSKIIFSIIILLIGKIRNIHEGKISKEKTKAYIFITIIATFVFNIFEQLFYTESFTNMRFIFSIFILLVFSVIFILMFFRTIIKEKSQQIKLLENQILIEEKKRLKQIKIINDNTLKMKHDLKHILSYVYNNIEMNKLEEAKKNIKDYVDSIEYSDSIIITENSILNFCVNKLSEQAKVKNIDFSASINTIYKPNIADNDLLLVLSNIFDNALENCEGMKKLEVIISKKNNYYILEVVNSISNESIDTTNLTTTKSNKVLHGHGLKSVKDIIKKYNGNFVFNSQNNKFKVKIALN